MPHTPGPWGRNIRPASKYPIVYAGRNTHVCQIISHGLPDEQIEANCDLVAAAPDLLAACKIAENNLASLYAPNHIVMRSLRDAIAKAEHAS